MIDLENKKHIWAISVIAVLGGMTFFQAGVLLSGDIGLLEQDSKAVASKEEVRDKVKN
ncbi:MAG: hypothetical protein ABEK10_01930 [Candidatus Nanosalina sp.]